MVHILVKGIQPMPYSQSIRGKETGATAGRNLMLLSLMERNVTRKCDDAF